MMKRFLSGFLMCFFCLAAVARATDSNVANTGDNYRLILMTTELSIKKQEIAQICFFVGQGENQFGEFYRAVIKVNAKGSKAYDLAETLRRDSDSVNGFCGQTNSSTVKPIAYGDKASLLTYVSRMLTTVSQIEASSN